MAQNAISHRPAVFRYSALICRKTAPQAGLTSLTLPPGSADQLPPSVTPDRLSVLGAVSVTHGNLDYATGKSRQSGYRRAVGLLLRIPTATQFHGGRWIRSYRGDPATPTVLAVNPLMRGPIIACSQARRTGTDEAPPDGRTAGSTANNEHPRATQVPSPTDRRLRHACALIADNLTQPMTLQIGGRIGVSQLTLSRLFSDRLV